MARCPKLAAAETPRPRPRPSNGEYDWTNVPAKAAPEDTSVAKVDLSPLRETLLHQFSESAARGVVDMAISKRIPASEDIWPTLPVQVRVGENIGMITSSTGIVPGEFINSGAKCLTDERLAIAEWGAADQILLGLGDTRANLTTEFDRPNPEAVKRAVQFNLFLGFGAEARQMMISLPTEDNDQHIWRAMANIVDGKPPDQNPFHDMQSCDTAAALWSALASDQRGNSENTQAVTRYFSELPQHLRQVLGPNLVDRYLASDDLSTAQRVQDAITRAPGHHGVTVEMAGAAVQHAMGQPQAAEATLQRLSAENGEDAARALVRFVDLRIAEGLSVEPAVVTNAAALAVTFKGTELERQLKHAQALAAASTGDFATAFGLRNAKPETEPLVWRILANQGDDDAVLIYALRSQNLEISPPKPEVQRKLAERLLSLGLADQALMWLPETEMSDLTSDDRILGARIHLGRRDALDAQRLLAGLDTQVANDLRAEASRQLGSGVDAEVMFAQAEGDADAQSRDQNLQTSPSSATAKGDLWSAVSEGLISSSTDKLEPQQNAPEPIKGELALAKVLLDESAKSRTAIDALLSAVPSVVATQTK